jgi:hypothetical protein
MDCEPGCKAKKKKGEKNLSKMVGVLFMSFLLTESLNFFLEEVC